MKVLEDTWRVAAAVYVPVDAVQLVVEAARVADGLAVIVASPERGVAGATVGAALAVAPRRRLRGIQRYVLLEWHRRLSATLVQLQITIVTITKEGALII